MTVYVNWYHSTVEGELLPDTYLGMRQVRIPLDGCHPVALFTPAHIYPTLSEAKSALDGFAVKDKLTTMQMEYPTTPEEAMQHPFKPVNYPLLEPRSDVGKLAGDAIAAVKCNNFLRDNWDAAHNHLRVDALDEFYQLWRIAHGGSRYLCSVDTASPEPDRTVITPVPAAAPVPGAFPPVFTPVPGAFPPGNRPATVPGASASVKKPTRRQLRSTSTITFSDSVQTSIFDLL